ncbi:MAG: hypothetical protein ACFHWZ_05625 [Phycisphaerales bacterium]
MSMPTDHPETGPLVGCRRCGTSFVCDAPELSGAVECPKCLRIAWLSKEDEGRVRDAASRQLQDGSYSRRFIEQRSEHLKALALPSETRETYAKLAQKLRRGAAETCPYCLYNLSGVLEGDEPLPCPECGEETSRPVNIMLWGQRSNATSAHSKVARFAWLAVSGWYFLTESLFSLFESAGWQTGLRTLAEFVTGIGTIALPFVVSYSAYAWLSLRNPTMNRAVVFLLALVYGVVNLAAALLLLVIGSLVFYYYA